MSAGGALQGAIAAALSEVATLSGVFDGPPARAAFPYAVINAASETDWGHKSGSGREVTLAITLWDDQPVRLQSLSDEVEQHVTVVSDVMDWQLVTFSLMRRRTVRDVAGPWATLIDFRARLLAN